MAFPGKVNRSRSQPHLPAPADGPLHGAIPRHRLPSKTVNLDAIATLMTPLVVVVAGKEQERRGFAVVWESSLFLLVQDLSGERWPLDLVLRIPRGLHRLKRHIQTLHSVLGP